MGKKGTSFTAGGNADWCSHCGKQYGGSSKIKNRVTTWPSRPSSGYLQNNVEAFICKKICTSMFIAALFVVAKTWKQPKFPLIDDCLDKEDTVHVHNGILLSHNKRWSTAMFNNVDKSWKYHAKQNKSDRTNQKPYDFTPMGAIKPKAINEQTRKTNENPETQKVVAWLLRESGLEWW